MKELTAGESIRVSIPLQIKARCIETNPHQVPPVSPRALLPKRVWAYVYDVQCLALSGVRQEHKTLF